MEHEQELAGIRVEIEEEQRKTEKLQEITPKIWKQIDIEKQKSRYDK